MDLGRLASWVDRSRSHRTVVTAGLFLGLLGIGALDSVTGSNVSFGVFYVLLVVAVTIVAGAVAGIAAALFSAVLWGAADIITSGSRLGVSVVLWNMVTRFSVHAIVVILLGAVLESLRSARESEARSRAFLATAAHQLRTPIAALRSSVDALLVEGSTPAQERLLANLAGEAGRLSRLATALLRTARLDQGEALRPRPVDIAELCRVEIERARQLSVAECRLTLGDGIPPLVVLDPDATSEILSNLLDNARRHACSVLELRVAAERDRLVVAVKDDGAGLPAGLERQAFERFVTLDGRGGTGLGLPIARELAQRQGGHLVYEGGAFILDLPAEAPAAAAGTRGAAVPAPVVAAGPAPAGAAAAGRRAGRAAWCLRWSGTTTRGPWSSDSRRGP
ncbi:MAG TPA: HAMP domain-containing sensor histidine kinase [Acidimicrobiia bacterium]|nr:HAMP domain-containing sensor histidine kinase [Acidimicrobiia bacterium]